MDRRRINSILGRVKTVAGRAGVDRVPGAKSAFRWLQRRNAARLNPIDHHGFDLYFSPEMGLWLLDENGVRQEPKVDATLRDLASEGDVAVDVGGMIGYHTLSLRRAVGASGRVVVFEPLPENAELIERTIRENGFENVTLERVAIGTGSDTATLSVPENEPSMPSMATEYEDGSEVTVDTVALSEYLGEAGIDRVDVAKFDVEGGEHAILCETDALDRIEAMVCEIHPNVLGPERVEAVVERLSSTGRVTDLDGNPLPVGRVDGLDESTQVVWERNREDG